jgi:hypothetical protein
MTTIQKAFDDLMGVKGETDNVIQKAFNELVKIEPDPIQKAFDDVLEKGGEGSKGGKVIGHTKSGKPIYDKAGHAEHKNFTIEDHNDAKKLHDNTAQEHFAISNKTKSSSVKSKYQTKGSAHTEQSNKHSRMAYEMERLKKQSPTVGFSNYHKKDEEKFFEVLSKYYTPKDDGESEYEMFKNINKLKNKDKILAELAEKFK